MRKKNDNRAYKIRKYGSNFIVTVPINIQVLLDLDEGDWVEFFPTTDGRVELKKVDWYTDMEESINNAIKQYEDVFDEIIEY